MCEARNPIPSVAEHWAPQLVSSVAPLPFPGDWTGRDLAVDDNALRPLALQAEWPRVLRPTPLRKQSVRSLAVAPARDEADDTSHPAAAGGSPGAQRVCPSAVQVDVADVVSASAAPAAAADEDTSEQVAARLRWPIGVPRARAGEPITSEESRPLTSARAENAAARKRSARLSPQSRTKQPKGGRALAAATWAILESQPVPPSVDGLIAESFGPVPEVFDDGPQEECKARCGDPEAARAPSVVRRPQNPCRSVIECGVMRGDECRLMALHSTFFGRAVDVFLVRCIPRPEVYALRLPGDQGQPSPRPVPR